MWMKHCGSCAHQVSVDIGKHAYHNTKLMQYGHGSHIILLDVGAIPSHPPVCSAPTTPPSSARHSPPHPSHQVVAEGKRPVDGRARAAGRHRCQVLSQVGGAGQGQEQAWGGNGGQLQGSTCRGGVVGVWRGGGGQQLGGDGWEQCETQQAGRVEVRWRREPGTPGGAHSRGICKQGRMQAWDRNGRELRGGSHTNSPLPPAPNPTHLLP
jgi:hypothetical protein